MSTAFPDVQQIRSFAAVNQPLPQEPRSDKEDEDFLDVGKLRTQYLDYVNTKVDEIEEQKNARRYYHGVQWSARELEIMRSRHQPPQTWNRCNRKVNAIVGLVERMRSDPKAFPRNPKSEAGAEIATQVIRYVLDANDWKGVDPWCLLQCCIDGVCGIQLSLVHGDQGDPDIELSWVIGDEYFYDPKSYRLDFSDGTYEGLSKWISLDAAIELFPDKKDDLHSLVFSGDDLTTNPDREFLWVLNSTKSLRMVAHWYRHKGRWCWAYYVSNLLLDQGTSPFVDEKGKSSSSFRMFSFAVDQDGDRYGPIRNLRGPQDALNQSKSKSLHLANTRRLILDKGAVDDVEIARREWARPDGVVEKNKGFDITPDDKTRDLATFIQFGDDAKSEIDQFANLNVAALTGGQVANISGRAIELLRQPGMAELGPFVLAYRQWKLAVYRLIWNTTQRYWAAQRWIRVSGNDGVGQFIQLNGLGLDQFGRPALVNALGSLDVNIILEEGPDVASLMADTYEALRGYPPGTFPPQVLIEMSSLPRSEKNRILQMMAPKPPPPNPAALAAQKLQLEGLAAKNAKTAADARLSDARAGQAVTKSQVELAEFQHDLFQEAIGLVQPPAPSQPASLPQPLTPFI